MRAHQDVEFPVKIGTLANKIVQYTQILSCLFPVDKLSMSQSESKLKNLWIITGSVRIVCKIYFKALHMNVQDCTEYETDNHAAQLFRHEFQMIKEILV